MVQDDRPVGLDGVQVKFDDERVVCDAGVMLVETLAERLGIEALAAELAANGPAWLRQTSFELDDNDGVLTLVQLERDSGALRDLEPFQRYRGARGALPAADGHDLGAPARCVPLFRTSRRAEVTDPQASAEQSDRLHVAIIAAAHETLGIEDRLRRRIRLRRAGI